MSNRSVPVFLVFVLALILAVPDGQAQKVISRAKLGHYTNDLAYVTKGRLSGHIVILEGWEVLAMPIRSLDPDEGKDASFDDESAGQAQRPRLVQAV